MSHCTCDYHQEQNKKRHLVEECEYCKAWEAETGYGKICDHKPSEERMECHCGAGVDCPLYPQGVPSEEKKDWEAEIPTTEQIVRLSRIALLAEILAEVENYPRKTYKTINEQCIQDGVLLGVTELIRKKMV